MFGISKMITQLHQHLARLERRILFSDQERRETAGAVSRQISDLCAAVKKHDMSMTDMLETWEELQQEQREETEKLRAALSGQTQKEAAAYEQRETALLELVISCHDQLYALRRTADSVWGRQLDLVEEKLSDGRLLAGLQVIDQKGVPVNYELHEVLNTVETADAGQAMRVADVYTRGYAYHGRVIRKAGVSAYQLAHRESADALDADGAAADTAAARNERGTQNENQNGYTGLEEYNPWAQSSELI